MLEIANSNIAATIRHCFQRIVPPLVCLTGRTDKHPFSTLLECICHKYVVPTPDARRHSRFSFSLISPSIGLLQRTIPTSFTTPTLFFSTVSLNIGQPFEVFLY